MFNFFVGLWLGGAAFAGPTAALPKNIRPSIAPWTLQAQYSELAEQRGEPVTVLACEPFWDEQAQLCFRLVDGEHRQWVTRSHLKKWGVSFSELKGAVSKVGKAAVREQLRPVSIEGINKQYWVASNADGWASGVLLSSEAFAPQLGTTSVLAAVPAHGIVLVWQAGDPELDKIVAVGVREIYRTKPGAVSAIIYRWTGANWVPFIEAVERSSDK